MIVFGIMIATQKTVEKAIEFIKEKLSPDKIYLFGSYATNNPKENSDIDFFIVKSTNLPKYKRTEALYSLEKSRRIGSYIPIDFIVYTPEEFEKEKKEINTIASEVLNSGKLVYGKR